MKLSDLRDLESSDEAAWVDHGIATFERGVKGFGDLGLGSRFWGLEIGDWGLGFIG